MRLYKTSKGNFLETGDGYHLLNEDWDSLINQDNLHAHLKKLSTAANKTTEENFNEAVSKHVLPPVGSQEVWAAGVTYLRSRDARMEESQDSGGADCYQKVYDAERPEIFFKSLPHRVAGPGTIVNIRKDSSWNVPEPELTLYISTSGKIQAYTIGNDMSSRSIEGENPLYLPQAKMYERSAALGPCLFVPATPISKDTVIGITIHRDEKEMFADSTQLSRMKRELDELAGYLFRACEFATGAFLMTGTCVVPPNEFTLEKNDVVTIRIDNIGELQNIVGVI